MSLNEVVELEDWARKELARAIPVVVNHHPGQEAIEEETTAWAGDIGLGEHWPDTRPIAWVGPVFRNASPEILRIAMRLFTAMCILDDRGDEKPWPTGFYRTLEQRLREAAPTADTDAFQRAFSEVRSLIAKAGGLTLLPDIADGFHRYWTASLVQHGWTRSGEMPDRAAYLRNRGERMMVEMLAMLQRLQPGLLSGDQAFTPPFRVVAETTAIVCGLQNDLVTYHRDLAEGCLNIIDVFHRGRGLSLRESFAAAFATFEALYVQLGHLVAALANDPYRTGAERAQATALLDWVAATERFQTEVPRYATAA